MTTDINIVISEWAYLAAAVLFVLGLRSLSSPGTARRGMFLAEIGMRWPSSARSSTPRS